MASRDASLPTLVQVLPHRIVTLASGSWGEGTLLLMPADEAASLVADGIARPYDGPPVAEYVDVEP